jgi:hypothetical protein
LHHSTLEITRPSDWCSEIGKVARDTADAALAHVLPKVEGAYRQMTGVPAEERQD